MKENAHSIRVWKILQTFGGIRMIKWNLTGWLVKNERIVSFIIKKENFHGVVSVGMVGESIDEFAVSYQDFSCSNSKEIIIPAKMLADLIGKVSNWEASEREIQAQGNIAPKDLDFPCSPACSF